MTAGHNIDEEQASVKGKDDKFVSSIYYTYLITGTIILLWLGGTLLQDYLGPAVPDEEKETEWISLIYTFFITGILFYLLLPLLFFFFIALIRLRKNFNAALPAALFFLAILFYWAGTFFSSDSSVILIVAAGGLFILYGLMATLVGFLGIITKNSKP